MTLSEAAEKGITKLTKPEWSDQSYIEIGISDGQPEAWADLYDPLGQAMLGIETPQQVPMPMISADWEEYKCPEKDTGTCDCFSYNKQEGETPNAVLDPNEYFDWDTPARSVCVDACIAQQIKLLWKAGIWTKGCCCGHGEDPPSVIVDTGESMPKAYQLLSREDPTRDWKVLQWQLIDYITGRQFNN